jgi:hypothetical protein
MKLVTKESKPAFSLLELSIVIMISGIILYSTLEMYDYFLNVDTYKQTNVKLAKLQTSLQNFFNRYGRLPCPADPTLLVTDANFGVEDLGDMTNGTTCRVDNKNPLYNNYSRGFPTSILFTPEPSNPMPFVLYYSGGIRHNIILGAIPFKTLGLQDDMMFDGYGNKFSYYTMEGYANIGKTTLTPYKNLIWSRVTVPLNMSSGQNCSNFSGSYRLVDNSGANNWISNSGYGCLQSHFSSSITPSKVEDVIGLVGMHLYKYSEMWNGSYDPHIFIGHNLIDPRFIDVYSHDEKSITKGEFAYSVISHGKSGLGAWSRAGALNPISMLENPSTATKKQYNSPAWIIEKLKQGAIKQIKLYSGLSLQHDNFDDHVVFGTTRELLTNAGMINTVSCHQSTLYLDIPSYITNKMPENVLFNPPNASYLPSYNKSLSYTSIRYNYIGLSCDRVAPGTWCYVNPAYATNRIANAYCNAGGKWSIAP